MSTPISVTVVPTIMWFVAMVLRVISVIRLKTRGSFIVVPARGLVVGPPTTPAVLIRAPHVL
jgi:hypothetical protein